MKKIFRGVLIVASSGALALMPLLASAQYTVGSQNLSGIILVIQNLLALAIPVLIAVGVIVFLWGVVKFVMSAGDEKARKEARNNMIFGIIAIAVMVGVYGFVNIVIGTFGFSAGGNIQVPTLPAGVK